MFRRLHGESLVEVLVAISVFVIGMAVAITLTLSAMNTQRRSVEGVKALNLALEGLEAARMIRDVNYSNLTNGNHGLAIAGSQWVFSGTSDTTDGYTRAISVSSMDAMHAYVTSTVRWNFTPSQVESIVLSEQYSNWELAIGGGPPTSFAYVGKIDLPGTAEALSIIVSGTTAYVGRDNSSGKEFNIIDVSDPTAPSLRSELEMADAVTVLGASSAYVYAGSNKSTREIRAINVSVPTAPTIGSTLNLSGNSNITGMVVSGTRLYVTGARSGSSETFHVVSIANPSTPAFLGGINLGDGAAGVVLAERPTPFVYLAGYLSNQEIQAVDASTPTAMIVGGSANLNGTENMSTLAVSGTLLFAGSAFRAADAEFFLFNVASPFAPSPLGWMDIGADVNAIHMTDDKTEVVLGTASTTAELLLVNAWNVTSPSIVASLDLSNTVTAMDAANGYLYVVTPSTTAELQIIAVQ